MDSRGEIKMMRNLLWSAEFDQEWDRMWSSRFHVTRIGMNVTDNYEDAFLTRAEEDKLVHALQGQEIFLVGYDLVTKEVLYKSPDLKLIMSVRDGPEENIDIDACTELGIPVLYSGGRCARGVAELNLLFMLLLARPVLPCSRIMRQDGWTEENYMPLVHRNDDASELFRKTVGIVGMGRNGRVLAQLANGMGMHIMAYDPYVNQKDPSLSMVDFTDLKTLFQQSDYICCLARVTNETKGMIGKELFSLMKKDACFINTGRAQLTDEEALLDVLEKGQIRGAAIDVFMEEPLGKASRFYQIPDDRLIITPHIAGFAKERIAHQYESLWDSLQKWIGGSRDIVIKNPEVFTCPEYKRRGALLCTQGKPWS